MTGNAQKRPSLAPRNWGGWAAVAIIWLLGILPRRLTLWLTEALGLAVYRLAGRRRKIAERNLERCFPEWPEEQRQRVLRAQFRSLGRMLGEMAWSWSSNKRRIDRMGELKGIEHVDAARQAGRGVLMVTSHNTCLEIGGRIMAEQVECSGIYRPLRNEALEWYQNLGRGRYTLSMLSKRNMRAAIRHLREGRVLWYAPDQDFGPEESVFAPFFGIPAATLLATHRLPKMTDCAVIMMFPWYDRKTRRYHVELLPALEDFPSDDAVADLTRVNKLIERSVLRAPEQYWWIHRRFKTRPPGEPPFYD